MSISNDPTHPKVAEDVEGHARWRGLEAQPDAEGLAGVTRPQERATDEDDVEGHMPRLPGRVEDDGGRTSADAHLEPEGLPRVKEPQEQTTDRDVEGHAFRRSAVPDDDVEGHGIRGKA